MLDEVYEFGILAVPLDHTSTRRKGAEHGPRAVLDSFWKGLQLDSIVNFRDNSIHKIRKKKVTQYDELTFKIEQQKDIFPAIKKIEESVQLLASHMFPIIIGGDHTVTYAAIKGVLKSIVEKNILIIVFDAHPDVWDTFPNLGKHWHGSFLRRLIDEKYIRGDQIHIIGLRGLIEKNIFDYIISHKINFYTSHQVNKIGIEEILKKILNHSREYNNGVYLSIDIDSLDPSFAPGTGTPEFEGITADTLLHAVEILAMEELVGLDVVEVNPLFDKSQKTEFLAAELIWRFIILYNN